MPDQHCTPGSTFPDATKEQVCRSGYARSVRDVSQSLKNKVYAEYGIARHSPGEYEVDHLISLSLAGSNELTNLWPEPATPAPGFHEKDKVEAYLHAQVCNHKISLKDAQAAIATNWKQFQKSSISYKVSSQEGEA
jgi:hypothetical protein